MSRVPSEAEQSRIVEWILTRPAAMGSVFLTEHDRDMVTRLVQTVLEVEHDGEVDSVTARVARAYDAGYRACLRDGEDRPTKDAVRHVLDLEIRSHVSIVRRSGIVDGIMTRLPEGTWEPECQPECNPGLSMYCSPECERRDRMRKAAGEE